MEASFHLLTLIQVQLLLIQIGRKRLVACTVGVLISLILLIFRLLHFVGHFLINGNFFLGFFLGRL